MTKRSILKKDHFRQICEVCGAAITRKGDIATHIALINAQMRSFAIFGVIKFSGVFCWVMSVKCLIFLVLLKFSYFVRCNIFRCNWLLLYSFNCTFPTDSNNTKMQLYLVICFAAQWYLSVRLFHLSRILNKKSVMSMIGT